MNGGSLDRIIECQQAMIAALDARDPDAIDAASAALAAAVAAVKSRDAWTSNDGSRAALDHALRQSDAARTRVNYLAEWNRQKFDALTALRRGRPHYIYEKPRNSGK